METAMHRGGKHELWKFSTVNGGGLPFVRRCVNGGLMRRKGRKAKAKGWSFKN